MTAATIGGYDVYPDNNITFICAELNAKEQKSIFDFVTT